jgi:hypothetical protein
MCLRRMESFRWIRMFLIRLITSESIFLFNYHLTRDEAAFRAAGSRVARQSRLSASYRFVQGASPLDPR